MQASLRVMTGKQHGREIPLPATLFVIGRDSLCHLRPHSELVSRRHCAIACWGGRILLRDLKSANGTYLNRRRVNREVEVHDGDILDVGGLSFLFQISTDDAEPVQMVRQEMFHWLTREPDNADVLNPEVATAMIQVGFLDGESAGAQRIKSEGGKNLSAGKYLRDYLGIK